MHYPASQGEQNVQGKEKYEVVANFAPPLNGAECDPAAEERAISELWLHPFKGSPKNVGAESATALSALTALRETG